MSKLNKDGLVGGSLVTAAQIAKANKKSKVKAVEESKPKKKPIKSDS